MASTATTATTPAMRSPRLGPAVLSVVCPSLSDGAAPVGAGCGGGVGLDGGLGGGDGGGGGGWSGGGIGGPMTEGVSTKVRSAEEMPRLLATTFGNSFCVVNAC